MEKVPKRANKAIGLLSELVEQLHYFYGNNDDKFRKNVLKHAVEIENILKDLAIDKKDTFKRIAKRYNEYYANKEELNNKILANAENLNKSIQNRYKKES